MCQRSSIVDRTVREWGSRILGVGAVSPGGEAGMVIWVLGLWTGETSVARTLKEYGGRDKQKDGWLHLHSYWLCRSTLNKMARQENRFKQLRIPGRPTRRIGLGPGSRI